MISLEWRRAFRILGGRSRKRTFAGALVLGGAVLALASSAGKPEKSAGAPASEGGAHAVASEERAGAVAPAANTKERAVAASTASRTIVICAPGYPGSTLEAQPTMQTFASNVGRAAGWKPGVLGAVYYETEQGGLDHLAKQDAVLALVPLPFFLQQGEKLGLKPRLQVVSASGASEVWSLVAKRGAVSKPDSLAGWEVTSTAGYAEKFVRGPAVDGWGPLPSGVRVTYTGRTLAALRRADAGEKIAVLLDAAGATALKDLPFAANLDIVVRSKPLPASLVCTVGNRLPAAEADALVRALQHVHESPDNTEVLKTMRMTRFEPVDSAAVQELVKSIK